MTGATANRPRGYKKSSRQGTLGCLTQFWGALAGAGGRYPIAAADEAGNLMHWPASGQNTTRGMCKVVVACAALFFEVVPEEGIEPPTKGL